jgi:hypothetical protein
LTASHLPKNLATSKIVSFKSDVSNMAAEPIPPPNGTAGPNHKNIALFDLTMWIFDKAARTTDKILFDASASLPLLQKKLDMAARILPAAHPQRQKHIDAVANITTLLAIGASLRTHSAAERQSYCDGMPEYPTGLFAQYNRDCVIRVLGQVNDVFEKMRVLNPGMEVDGQFKNLKKTMSHFEGTPAKVLTRRSICML